MSLRVFILFCLFISCKSNNFKDLELDRGKIYLFFRGTDTKQGVVVRNYNLYSKDVSHVGIGEITSKGIEIYNITDDIENSFQVSNLQSFYDKDNIKYCSIWEIEGGYDKTKFRNIIDGYKHKDIKFDKFFLSKDGDDKLYCSEFVVNVLEAIDSIKFKFAKHKKPLNSLHSNLLEKDTLTYYPVDIFTLDSNLKKVFEYYF